MPTEIDLRGQSAERARDELFETFAAAEPGDEFEVVADADVDAHLVRFQIEHDRALTWTYDHPDAEPRTLRATVGDLLDADALGTIDVRDLKPQRRHEALLDVFDELGAGEGFVLVNDHDPKPLYHELRSTHGGVVDWTYRSRGEDGWRVEVVKTGESDAPDDDVVTRYDVRDIPKEERHPTIHHRYGMLPDGGTMELIAPHEPRPLRGEFQERYGDAFSWTVVEDEPGRCRVRITKAPAATEEADDGTGAEDGGGSAEGEAAIDVVEELDVRDLPPAERHEQIFVAYDELDGGTGFVLVNDHDPKPLYHQFDAETGPEFRWEYRQREPGEFRVLVGKTEETGRTVAGPKDSADGAPDAPF